ncbi:MAG: LLM class flavin-dependent oxidoreductase, partial [Pseudomonadota bacterium]
ETAPLLRPLWEGDCAHEGAFFQFPATTAAPKPKQEGGPPIWIAARDPNSFEFAVQNGFHVQVTPLWQGMEEVETLAARFDAACAEYAGPRPKCMLLHHSYVGSDTDDVDMAAQEFSRFYNYFGAWFQNKRPVRQGLIEEISDTDMAGNAKMSPANMRRDLTMGTAVE